MHASPIPTDGRTSDGGRTAQRTARDPAPTADRLAELCSKCEYYLRREEMQANERPVTAAARRGRCDDCYRKSPAPNTPIVLLVCGTVTYRNDVPKLYVGPPIWAIGAADVR